MAAAGDLSDDEKRAMRGSKFAPLPPPPPSSRPQPRYRAAPLLCSLRPDLPITDSERVVLLRLRVATRFCSTVYCLLHVVVNEQIDRAKAV